jgi:ABC-type tungstate transport system substrate-binding protein
VLSPYLWGERATPSLACTTASGLLLFTVLSREGLLGNWASAFGRFSGTKRA